MGGLPRSLLAAAAALAVVATTADALAVRGPDAPAVDRGRAKVQWTRVDVPEGAESARLTRVLRKLLDEAARKADFGAEQVAARARIVELTWERRDDVLHVSCTMVGRLEGGPSARSRIA